MKALFGNSGKRVCIYAFIVCIIGLVSMGLSIFLMLIGLIAGDEDLFFLGLIGLISCGVVAFSSLFLYAFGQLVSDTHAIREKVVGPDEKKPNAYNVYASVQAPMYQPQGYAPQPMGYAPQPQYSGYPMQNQ
jgi:hypothetical protein